MRSCRRAVLCAAVLFAASRPADGQTPVRPRTPPRPVVSQQRIGLRGYVTFGSTTLAASDTFEAVAGTRRRGALGGGGQVTGLWKGVFADVAGSQMSLDGERVFVDGGRVFKLGIPLEITLRPVDVAAGWRFRLLRDRLFPYAGVGLTYLHYEETSQFAAGGEDVSEGKAGPLFIGGADVRLWRWISAGGELRWRRVTGILGGGGASGEFGEDDAGGVNVAMRISVGR
jgi:hypothetical protein